MWTERFKSVDDVYDAIDLARTYMRVTDTLMRRDLQSRGATLAMEHEVVSIEGVMLQKYSIKSIPDFYRGYELAQRLETLKHRRKD